MTATKGTENYPSLAASSGEIICNLARSGAGIACISDFVTHEMRENGEFRQVLTSYTYENKLPINAVYYRSQALSPRCAVLSTLFCNTASVLNVPVNLNTTLSR